MALQNVFNAMKREGYVIRPLDLYLLSLNSADTDRAINVNAPSSVGTCMRARYYSRTQEERDSNSVDGRARRIFDNGTHFHIRMQEYMKDMKLLLMDEVPVLDEEYNIQGHTDGILDLNMNGSEYAILELKSINERGFTDLKTAKPEHKRQGLVYVYCVEKHRKYLHEKYCTENSFKSSALVRKSNYVKRYQHLKGGRKYTKAEKIMMQVDLHMRLDRILWECNKPITKCIFLYENKNNQELKEFCVSMTDSDSKLIMKDMLQEFEYINECVENGTVPPREGRNKSESPCRWCDYKSACYVI